MVKVWYMNDSAEDPKLEHQKDPPEYVTLENLTFTTGVECYRVNVVDLRGDITFNKLKRDNGYNYQDIIEISKEKMKDYDVKLKIFYTEHLHDDDEIRLFLEGSGYFDVRDNSDRWLRIKAAKGDLIILPAGIYHRFTPDTKEYAKVMRLFSGKPDWTAVNRPTDGNVKEIDERDSRKRHLSNIGKNVLKEIIVESGAVKQLFVKKDASEIFEGDEIFEGKEISEKELVFDL